MRPEDLDDLFEEAFSKIEPRDDAHREKLARLKERLIASNEDMRVTLEDATRKFNEPNSGFEQVKAISAERSRLAIETQSQMVQLFDEQTALIDRITRASRA